MKKIRSIPPITSTGKKVRNPNAPLAGLANISIGRYISERKSDENGEKNDENWNITKHTKSNFKKTKNTTKPIIYDNKKIDCIIDIIEDYNDENDLAITLQFKGFEFSGDFKKIDNENNKCSYFIPINYNGKGSYLFLTTIGDIFEYDIVINEKGIDSIFNDEAYIPKLLQIYDSNSMVVTLKNNFVVITYKKSKNL